MARGKNVELSDYELKRQENIAKTQALLRNLEMEAAQAGLGPTNKARVSTSSKQKSKKPAPKKIKQEEIVPRRTSSRLKGIEADSDKAKRKAEEEFVAIKEADRAKRQRISGAFNFSDITVVGKGFDRGGNFLSIVGPANPYERTFDAEDVKETTDKELRALRERMSGLQLWEDYEPNEIKITPERIYAMGMHPTTEKPLVFAGDKLGNLGICDASQKVAEVKQEDDEDADEEGPQITTLKPHTRTIHTFQFSPHDSNALFSASYDSTVRKLDLAKGVAVEVYAPSNADDDAPLSGLEISKDDPNMLYFSTLVRNVYVRTACETNTDFVHVPLERPVRDLRHAYSVGKGSRPRGLPAVRQEDWWLQPPSSTTTSCSYRFARSYTQNLGPAKDYWQG